MKTVYLVRHGEAQNNTRTELLYMAEAALLTEKGMQQAQKIAKRAEHLDFELLIASDFKRSQQTAEIVGQAKGLVPEISKLFGERHGPSSLVGRPFSDPETRKLELAWERTFLENDTRVEDGENFSDIKDRARKALKFLEEKKEEKILIVTHGFFLRILSAYVIFGEDFSPEILAKLEFGMRTTNTGITVLTFDPEDKYKRPWYLRVWNDHAHLG